jgi:hypothetical protein
MVGGARALTAAEAPALLNGCQRRTTDGEIDSSRASSASGGSCRTTPRDLLLFECSREDPMSIRPPPMRPLVANVEEAKAKDKVEYRESKCGEHSRKGSPKSVRTTSAGTTTARTTQPSGDPSRPSDRATAISG